jgi:hypothetical protein
VTRIPRWIPAYAALLLASSGTALLLVPILNSENTGAELFFVAHQYVLAPLAALVMTAFAARRGAEPYTVFFPPFVCLWLLPPLFALRALPVSVLLTFFMGVIGANAGKELRRRKSPPR